MWSGSASAIPSGWNLCDGNNGTPNLVNRFIKGGSSAGATGGSGTTSSSGSHSHSHSLSAGSHALSTSQMPSHSHSSGMVVGTYMNASNYWANEWTGGNTGTTGGSGSHSHSLSGSINSDGSHSHTIEPTYYTLCYIMKA